MRIDELMKVIDKRMQVYITSVMGDIWQGKASEFDEGIFWYSPLQFVASIETANDGGIIINATQDKDED